MWAGFVNEAVYLNLVARLSSRECPRISRNGIMSGVQLVYEQ